MQFFKKPKKSIQTGAFYKSGADQYGGVLKCVKYKDSFPYLVVKTIQLIFSHRRRKCEGSSPNSLWLISYLFRFGIYMF